MKEIGEYIQFTTPAELHKSINTLRGIVAGINSDTNVGTQEVDELIHWCEVHTALRSKHPFSEIIPTIEAACADGVVTEEEAKDIFWLCGNFADNSSYYDQITSSVQFLSGMVHGIMADGKLSDAEIVALKKWMATNEFLSGTYPYDEINSLLYSVLDDGTITDTERNQLMAFLGNLIDFTSSKNLVKKDFEDLQAKYNIGGICAVCPEIKFEGHIFCFTGESVAKSRTEISAEISSLGGTLRNGVSKNTDYLIVGNAGNPCWAYSCYGRKIEEAIQLRKAGAKVIIVNENDFWDAVEDTKCGIN